MDWALHWQERLLEKLLALHSRLDKNPYYRKFWRLAAPLQITLIVLAVLLWNIVVISLLYLLFGPTVAMGFFASLCAGLATVLGVIPVLFFRQISLEVMGYMLGLAAGIMLSATAYSLVEPGIEYGNALWPGKGVFIVSLGMLLGAWFLEWSDRQIPHELPLFEGEHAATLRRIWLFVLAITLHNFPEGLSVGVSYGAEDWRNGKLLAIAIGVQNIPEGMAVALPLLSMGYSPLRAGLVGMISGFVEPLGGLLGVTMVTFFHTLLPWAMGFAAGAMLYVIAYDIIPEIQLRKRSKTAVFAVLLGFAVMTILESIMD